MGNKRPIFTFNQAALLAETDTLDGDYKEVFNVQVNTGLGVEPFLEAFEFYRILSWTVTIIPFLTNNVANAMGKSIIDVGEIMSVIDYNGGSIPPGSAEMKSWEGVRITRGNRIHRRHIKPAIQRYLYDGGIADVFGFEPAWRRWVRTVDGTVPHYGLAVFIQTSTTSTSLQYRIEGKFTVQFMKRKDPDAANDPLAPTGVPLGMPKTETDNPDY